MTSDLVSTVLTDHPIWDGHNDLPWEMRTLVGYNCAALDIGTVGTRTHTDLPRLRAGGVGAQFWSVFVPGTIPEGEAVVATLEQVDFVRSMTSRYADELAFAVSAADVDRAWSQGRIASLMGAEGGQSIGSSMGALRMLHALGVRYLTLTHTRTCPGPTPRRTSACSAGSRPSGTRSSAR